MSQFGLLVAEASTGIDWSAVKFDGVLDGVKDAIPYLIPTIIGFVALRKAWGFAMGQIKKA